jgi:hypothetical protein
MAVAIHHSSFERHCGGFTGIDVDTYCVIDLHDRRGPSGLQPATALAPDHIDSNLRRRPSRLKPPPSLTTGQ